jgi:hypothetical protein
MDSEPKKQQFDEEAISMEMEEAEQKEFDEDYVELEEDDDNDDQSEWENDMRKMDEIEEDGDDTILTMVGKFGWYLSNNEEDSDYDEEDFIDMH